MLRSLIQLYGAELGASDGEIGQVRDFYFDDQNWAIRYLVADTGSWLPGRQVLLSPHALGRVDQAGKILRVNLTRKQIENSPPIASRKPVSRQYEEEYYRYYGWPSYWQGDGLWGAADFPIVQLPPEPLPGQRAAPSARLPEGAAAHLRSTLAVTGYHVGTGGGTTGHVCDFMVDVHSWAIGQLVVKIGHRFSGQEVLVPTEKVQRVSYEESTIFVNLTADEVAGCSPRHPVAAAAPEIDVIHQVSAL